MTAQADDFRGAVELARDVKRAVGGTWYLLVYVEHGLEYYHVTQNEYDTHFPPNRQVYEIKEECYDIHQSKTRI